MIGRIVGALIGAAIAVTGYGMLKPALFARYVDFGRLSLGPFAEYKVVVCWLIVAFGLMVVLASLQRPTRKAARRRPKPTVFAPAEPVLADEPGPSPMAAPEDAPPEAPRPEPMLSDPVS